MEVTPIYNEKNRMLILDLDKAIPSNVELNYSGYLFPDRLFLWSAAAGAFTFHMGYGTPDGRDQNKDQHKDYDNVLCSHRSAASFNNLTI